MKRIAPVAGFLLCSAMAAMAAPAHAIKAFPTGLTANVVYKVEKGATNVKPADVYDVDLFDTDAATIAMLKTRDKQAGEEDRLIICYFSAGSSENWRPDYKSFTSADKGDPLDDWDGENWLDIRSANVRSIMKKRMDLAVQKKCDAVDPDNVDGYSNENGLSLSKEDQLDYNKFLATEAHARGLAIGLKNDTEQAQALEPSFDFSIVESCFDYSECAQYNAFFKANKAIFGMQYDEGNFSEMCKDAKKNGMSTALYNLDLDGSIYKTCEPPAKKDGTTNTNTGGTNTGGGTTAKKCQCKLKK
ncbi:MAG: endo alpha-1,4 polygalactosaminidase [Rickettsiales bacterium]